MIELIFVIVYNFNIVQIMEINFFKLFQSQSPKDATALSKNGGPESGKARIKGAKHPKFEGEARIKGEAQERVESKGLDELLPRNFVNFGILNFKLFILVYSIVETEILN